MQVNATTERIILLLSTDHKIDPHAKKTKVPWRSHDCEVSPQPIQPCLNYTSRLFGNIWIDADAVAPSSTFNGQTVLRVLMGLQCAVSLRYKVAIPRMPPSAISR